MRAVQKVGIYVDKERLTKALSDARSFYEEGYIAAMIAADVVEVKRGRWVWNGKHWECSNCRHDRLHDLVLGLDAAYCPYCGADLRERKEDGTD